MLNSKPLSIYDIPSKLLKWEESKIFTRTKFGYFHEKLLSLYNCHNKYNKQIVIDHILLKFYFDSALEKILIGSSNEKWRTKFNKSKGLC